MARQDVAWSGITETVVASAARIVSGATAALPGYGPASSLRAQLNVTAVAGTDTPTLHVYIEDTLDGTNWNTIMDFGLVAATTRLVYDNYNSEVRTLFSDQLRVRWVITGTNPSFTFSVAWSAE